MTTPPPKLPQAVQTPDTQADTAKAKIPPAKPAETGGPSGPEPTRYGDWERGGRCIDF